MWKIVLADDEKVILNGLKKLVPWTQLGFEIVGEAGSGIELINVIRETKPDIVISDIRMPGITGIEVLQTFQDKKDAPEFIFISGYQEFGYVKSAMQLGAVDYLLKPVAAKELEKVLKKAAGRRMNYNVEEIFSEDQDDVWRLLQKTNDDSDYVSEELYQYFSDMAIDFERKFFVGVCFGIDTSNDDAGISYEKEALRKFIVYNKLQEIYKNNKFGFTARKEQDCCCLIAVIPIDERDIYMEKYFLDVKKQLETICHITLRLGIGMPTTDVRHLKNTYKTAKFAYDLYFFEPAEVIDFMEVHKDFNIGEDDYEAACARVFPAIAAKDANVVTYLEKVLDVIENMHYGNAYAAVNRCLIFTGDLTSKLFSYHLLEGEFLTRQDALQEQLVSFKTFKEIKDYLLGYYISMLPEIDANGRKKETGEIVRVKQYIQENYMHDISLKDLAEIACVSPYYFSSFFKKATDENYKAYLTKIRLDAAMHLVMDSDMKTYEIAEAVGYNNVRRFVDAFKAVYNLSPMDYRKVKKRT